MIFNKYSLKPFKISSEEACYAEVKGRSFKDENGAAEDAKFYAAEFSYNQGFRYFNIKNLSISQGHGCKHFLLSFEGTNSPNIKSISSVDTFNEREIERRNILFSKRINRFVILPVSLVFICFLAILFF